MGKPVESRASLIKIGTIEESSNGDRGKRSIEPQQLTVPTFYGGKRTNRW
ncbi:hypothetical protein MOE45_07305 [Bacillus atrophaeus]|nr:hypothetical protein [Bacillus atrophaeus]